MSQLPISAAFIHDRALPAIALLKPRAPWYEAPLIFAEGADEVAVARGKAPDAYLVQLGGEESAEADGYLNQLEPGQMLERALKRAQRLISAHERRRRAEQDAQALSFGSELLRSLHDEDEIFLELVQHLAKALESERVSLLSVDADSGYLTMRASVGIPEEVRVRARPRIGEGIAGLCAARGTPIYIADHEQIRGNDGGLEEHIASEFTGSRLPMSLTVPLFIRGEVIGVVNVTARQNQRPYRREDIDFISTFMSHASYLLESATLFQQLRSLKAFSDDVIQTFADPLFVLDEAGVVVRSNRGALTLFGMELEIDEPMANELLTLSFEQAQQLQDAIRSRDKFSLPGLNYGAQNFDLRLTPFSDDPHILLILHDVTERKQMAKQLVSAEKMASLGILAAGVAHEINNPLGYVRTNTRHAQRCFDELFELIDRWQALSPPNTEIQKVMKELEVDELREDYPQMMRECLEGLDRIQKITKSLKSFAHPDTETPQQAKVSDLIEQSMIITRGKWKADLDVELALNETPVISCLPNQLEQVFMNLIVNAAQAAKGLGRRAKMTISSESREGVVTVAFQDTCGGIPDSLLDRIFDPFFTTKEIGEGTGLGLHIAHNIISGHGGEIDVQSIAGEGTCFQITLPLQRSQEPLVVKQLSRFRL
ncbi:MAG: ATP-binding protein [Myxococcota bacterium]|nr:ATP-binding protein [Myxococcota bacterium]